MDFFSANANYIPNNAQNDPDILEMGEAMKSGMTIDELRDYKSKRDGTSPLVVDSGDKEIDDFMNRIAGLPAETKDYLTEYFLNEKSRKNAFNDSMMASNTQYQRAVADLKKAGLNPFLAFDALRGSAPSSSAGSVSGGHNVSRVNNEKGLGVKAGAIIAALLAAFIGVIGNGVASRK